MTDDLEPGAYDCLIQPAGHVSIAEYTNMGDVQWETPMEPAAKVHTVAIGEVSGEIARETRMVVLFATAPCRVAFVPDGKDLEAAESHAFPVAAEAETFRIMHLNTAFRVATYERGD